MPARIACLDLDTFFVSVERLFDPSLVGKPVIVGGSPGSRGVVTSASYEARVYGVKSGMSAAEAARLAPNAIFLPTRHGVYSDLSSKVREILEQRCPVVRQASIDEFYLDLRGCEGLFKRPGDADADATIFRSLKETREAIQAELGLPASIGIGRTRPIAKIASRKAKPAGVFMVREGREREFVGGMPVRAWPGIGPSTEAKLLEAGIPTMAALLGSADERFGRLIDSVRRAVDEEDPGPSRDRPAFHEHDPHGETEGSISNERTFPVDVGGRDVAHAQLRALVERVVWRARTRGVRARTITLRLRYADFETITRSHTRPATDSEMEVLAEIDALLDAAWTKPKRLRLLGVGLSNLVGPEEQMPLPFGPAKPPVGSAVDAVRSRFGFDAIRFGAPARRASER
jgi:DNA polymerase-4